MKADAVDRFMAREYSAERHYESKLGARYIVEYRSGAWRVFGWLADVPKEVGKA